MHTPFLFLACATAAVLTACGSAPNTVASHGHLAPGPNPAPGDRIPKLVQHILSLPPPQATAKTQNYSVVVNNVKTEELLFSLARDAGLNVDIHPGIGGNITLNAVDQTLSQLLARIAKQADIRWELDGPNLAVMPDTPFLRAYRIDYVNMSRETEGTVTVTTQIASPGSGSAGDTTSASGGNNSITKVDNKSVNHFWETLEKNIKDILRETDKLLPEGSSETVIEKTDQQTTTGTGATSPASGHGRRKAPATIAASPNPASMQEEGTTVVRRTNFHEAAAVIVNAETGIVTVRASARQHEKIQEFVDQVMASASRQVLIEATIAEVTLSDGYQQGIDWSAVHLGRAGFSLRQLAAGTLSAPPANIFEIGYVNDASRAGRLSGTARLLESFGKVKVLSSPKLSVLNNQTAVLKVVDNNVYFTIKADTSTNANTSTTTFTTTPHSVPVGFVMNVTPQIGEAEAVLLNIRPSVSRIIGSVADPNPALKKSTANGFASDIVSSIPVIRTREMDSMIRVESGNIAVMGGLMEDLLQDATDAVPGLHRVPAVGAFFENRDQSLRKTELVVFLRPTVIKDGSLAGDYRDFRELLPDYRSSGSRSGMVGGQAGPQADSGNARAEAIPSGTLRINRKSSQLAPTLHRAYAALKGGDLPAARQAYEETLADEPRNLDALHGMAVVHLRSAEHAAATECLARALEADPADSLAQAALIGLNDGLDPLRAESRLKLLIAAQPNMSLLYFSLGNIYARQQRWAEARQAYLRASAGEPASADYLFNLAVSLDQLHQPAEAARYYAQALALADAGPVGFDAAQVAERLTGLRP